MSSKQYILCLIWKFKYKITGLYNDIDDNNNQ